MLDDFDDEYLQALAVELVLAGFLVEFFQF
jgi:hypothetical protein